MTSFENRLHLVLLALPAVVIVSAAQASCSAQIAVTGGAPDAGPSSCAAGDMQQVVGGQTVCCRSAGAGLDCAAPGAAVAGAACSPAGATATGKSFTVSPDSCVTEACSGDRTAVPFADTTQETTGTLQCANGAWQWSAPSVHTVVRVCTVTGSLACPGVGYYGYGYYAGSGSVPLRAVSVISSTCTSPSGGDAPCPPGDL